MHEKKIRRIPIVDKNNNLVGIVTENDIFKLLMKNKDLLCAIVDDNTPILLKNQYITILLVFGSMNLFLKDNNIFHYKYLINI